MSSAKKAVDSTIKRILVYTGEIIASLVLLIILSFSLVFAVPMWLQHIALGVPRGNLAINPIAWFGILGAVSLIISLAAASGVLGFIFVKRFLVGTSRIYERKERSDDSEDGSASEDES